METDVGTLIDEAAACRVEAGSRMQSRVEQIWRPGGSRRRAQIDPAVLTGVTLDIRVVCDAVYGPVLNILPFDHFDAVCRDVSESCLGLQYGVFTKSLETRMRAIRTMRTGGLIVDGTLTWRTDQLAYGGVKDSGIGRE